MKIIIDFMFLFLGGFVAVAIFSEYDAWKRYKKKVSETAFKIVYSKVCDMERKYYLNGKHDVAHECIRLQNLMNYFKEELCNKHSKTNH